MPKYELPIRNTAPGRSDVCAGLTGASSPYKESGRGEISRRPLVSMPPNPGELMI